MGLAALSLAVLLSGAGGTLALRAALTPADSAVPACEGNDDLFPAKISQVEALMDEDNIQPMPSEDPDAPKPDNIVKAWSLSFHRRMNQLVEAHLKQTDSPISCDAGIRMAPSEDLKKLAERLPQWKDSAHLENLSESDMPVVALAYLESYECTLKERDLATMATSYQSLTSPEENSSETGDAVPVSTLNDANMKEQGLLQTELLLARPTVHRVLTALSGRTRLTPILNALQCLQLASIDIRNALSLAAQVASTLPRGWDVRTTLRNPAPQQ